MSDKCDVLAGPCACGAWHDACSSVVAPIVGKPAEADPSGRSSKEPGAKLDAGKIDVVRGALHYFPLALEAVAELSQLGAQKYSWGGWREVPDGRNRYTAALGRHLLKEQTEGLLDEEWAAKNIKVLHATAVAWNALARLELLREELK